MKVKHLIALLQHVEKEKGGDIEIVFQNGLTSNLDAAQFEIGEESRTKGNFSVTPYETEMYIDGWGRYVLPLCRWPWPEITPEMEKQSVASTMRSLFCTEERAKVILQRSINHYKKLNSKLKK